MGRTTQQSLGQRLEMLYSTTSWVVRRKLQSREMQRAYSSYAFTAKILGTRRMYCEYDEHCELPLKMKRHCISNRMRWPIWESTLAIRTKCQQQFTPAGRTIQNAQHSLSIEGNVLMVRIVPDASQGVQTNEKGEMMYVTKEDIGTLEKRSWLLLRQEGGPLPCAHNSKEYFYL